MKLPLEALVSQLNGLNCVVVVSPVKQAFRTQEAYNFIEFKVVNAKLSGKVSRIPEVDCSPAIEINHEIRVLDSVGLCH